MQRSWRRRAGTVLVAALLAVQTGCGGGWQSLERDELVTPEPAKSYRVTTKNGDQMTFISLHLEGDALVGTRRITVVETVGQGETGRRNVTNRYEETRLPWEDVAVVEADRGRRSDHSLWFAAGAIVVGVAAFLILTGDSVDEPSGGGGVERTSSEDPSRGRAAVAPHASGTNERASKRRDQLHGKQDR